MAVSVAVTLPWMVKQSTNNYVLDTEHIITIYNLYIEYTLDLFYEFESKIFNCALKDKINSRQIPFLCLLAMI